MNNTAQKYAADFLGSWLAFRARQVALPGFSVAVYHNGQVLFSQAYGLADTALEVPMTTSHVFVASQSKMITATAVLQLAAQDKLNLDDRIIQHLPWLAEHYDNRFHQITVRQLLTHSAGMIRDGTDSDY